MLVQRVVRFNEACRGRERAVEAGRDESRVVRVGFMQTPECSDE